MAQGSNSVQGLKCVRVPLLNGSTLLSDALNFFWGGVHFPFFFWIKVKKMNPKQLKEELKNRGKPTQGNKNDLIKRLLECS